jgi:hypothetical protein
MRKYNYQLPTTSTFYASFDYGEVWADTLSEAKAKAIEKIKYDVQKVNDALAFSDNTAGFTIEICTDELEVKEANN